MAFFHMGCGTELHISRVGQELNWSVYKCLVAGYISLLVKQQEKYIFQYFLPLIKKHCKYSIFLVFFHQNYRKIYFSGIFLIRGRKYQKICFSQCFF